VALSDRDRGLDLLKPNTTGVDEVTEFRSHSERTYGQVLPGFEFWLEHRPELVKRHRLLATMSESDEGRAYPLRGVLASLHYYAIVGYEEGVRYQIAHCRAHGATKGHVLDTLAIAFLHSSVLGMNQIAAAANDCLAKWVDSEEDPAKCFPPNWKFDPGAFVTGIDFSTPEMTPAELKLLEVWHLSHGGEVPQYVEFLGRWRPNLLKAHRNRIEHVIAGDLPKQMLPFLQLFFQVLRGNRDGIREATLLGISFGLSHDAVMDGLCKPFSLAGPSSLGLVEDAVGDILSSWR
jgi:hypothetical protein